MIKMKNLIFLYTGGAKKNYETAYVTFLITWRSIVYSFESTGKFMEIRKYMFFKGFLKITL